MDSFFRLYVSPCGNTAIWKHVLDDLPQYADWIDATELSDDEFEALVTRLQRASATPALTHTTPTEIA